MTSLRYFTFLPDFVPQILMKPLLRIERWLERSPLARLSVHYMVTLEKNGSTHEASPAPSDPETCAA